MLGKVLTCLTSCMYYGKCYQVATTVLCCLQDMLVYWAYRCPIDIQRWKLTTKVFWKKQWTNRKKTNYCASQMLNSGQSTPKKRHTCQWVKYTGKTQLSPNKIVIIVFSRAWPLSLIKLSSNITWQWPIPLPNSKSGKSYSRLLPTLVKPLDLVKPVS